MSQRSNGAMPRWVKVLGVIIIVLILLVAFVLITDLGGPHGPGRHLPPDSNGGALPSRIITSIESIGDSVGGQRLSGGGSG